MEKLLKQQIELISRRVYVQVVYRTGRWLHILNLLPSDKSIEIFKSGECQDGDLYMEADIADSEWYLEDGHDSYIAALTEGIERGIKLAQWIDANP